MLPDKFGDTTLKRVCYVYKLMFQDRYGIKPMLHYARIKAAFKTLFEELSEFQIAALVILHFDWHGANGDDTFTFSRLSNRCFPMEWIPNAVNEYRAYFTNALGVDFNNEEAVSNYVKLAITPLYQTQYGTTATESSTNN